MILRKSFAYFKKTGILILLILFVFSGTLPAYTASTTGSLDLKLSVMDRENNWDSAAYGAGFSFNVGHSGLLKVEGYYEEDNFQTVMLHYGAKLNFDFTPVNWDTYLHFGAGEHRDKSLDEEYQGGLFGMNLENNFQPDWVAFSEFKGLFARDKIIPIFEVGFIHHYSSPLSFRLSYRNFDQNNAAFIFGTSLNF